MIGAVDGWVHQLGVPPAIAVQVGMQPIVEGVAVRLGPVDIAQLSIGVIIQPHACFTLGARPAAGVIRPAPDVPAKPDALVGQAVGDAGRQGTSLSLVHLYFSLLTNRTFVLI